MTDPNELAFRIAKLEARFAISELVTSYAVACDEHDMPRLISLFAEDAVIDTTNKTMVASGVSEISDMFVRMFKIRGPGYHWTHDHTVAFDAKDPARAKGTVLSHAETCPNGVASLAAMKYSDDYVQLDDRWVFQKRVLQFLYYVPAKDYMQALGSRKRFTVGGNSLPADYPESLSAWQAFEREHKTT